MRLKVLVLALVFAISFVGVFTSPAKAEGPALAPFADVCFWAGYTSYSKEANPYAKTAGKTAAGTEMGIVPQADFGAVGTSNGVTVMVDLMLKTPHGNSSEINQVYLFLANASYKFGDLGMMIGLAPSPFSVLTFDDKACYATANGWELLLEYGMFDPDKQQVKLTYNGFYFEAAANSYQETNGYKTMLPLLAAGYVYGNPGTPFMAQAHGVFMTYKIADTAAATDGKSVTDYAIAADFSMNMAPFGFQVHAHYAQNPGDMGIGNLGPYGGAPVAVGSSFKNTKVFAGFAAVNYTVDKARLGAGFGYFNGKPDVDGAKAHKQYAFYVDCQYSIQPNFSLTPIFHYQDNGKDYDGVTKLGKQWTMGVFVSAHV